MSRWSDHRADLARCSEHRARMAQARAELDAREAVVREHSLALAQLVRETRESGVHVEAWTVRAGSVR